MIRVLHMIGSLDVGGSQVMIMNLYKKIDRNIIQFDFVIDHSDQLYFADEIESLGGKIYVLPSFKGYNIKEVKYAWYSFFKQHNEYKILHSHVRSYASIYLPIAKKMGLKTIIHSHSTSNGKGFISSIKSLLQIPLRFQADYFMACSQEAGVWLFGKRIIKKDNYYIIKNAIDVQLYKFNSLMRDDIRNRMGIQNKIVLGHVGRMTTPKNHLFLISLVSRLIEINKDIVLLLVGDGELRKDIENKCRELDIMKNVFFVGNVKNVYRYYNAMDLFLFPSLWEGLGMSLIEAQASGLKCLCSDRVPVSAILSDNVKVLPLDNINEWVDNILDEKEYNRHNCMDMIKDAGYDVNYNAEWIADFYERIY